MRAFVSIALIASLAPTVARAQDDDGPASAAQLFAEGRRAVDEGRWSDALASFRGSYALAPNPVALYSEGIALRSLGRHLEARDTFVRLLEDHPEAPAELREGAEGFRVEEAARLGTLSITGLEDIEHRLRLGEREITDTLARPLLVESDPGRFLLLAECEGMVPARADVTVDEGATSRVTLTLSPFPEDHEPDVPLGADPLFWAILGGSAVAAAVAIVVLVVLATPVNAVPTSDRIIRL